MFYMDTSFHPQKGHSPPIFGPCLFWLNAWMDQDATWYGGRPRPRRYCVRWGSSSPPKAHSPQFLAHMCCGQTTGWIKIPLSTEVDLGPGDIVLDGDTLALPKRGTAAPQFPAYVCCGQTAGSTKMPLGTEIGLGPGHVVR